MEVAALSSAQDGSSGIESCMNGRILRAWRSSAVLYGRGCGLFAKREKCDKTVYSCCGSVSTMGMRTRPLCAYSRECNRKPLRCRSFEKGDVQERKALLEALLLMGAVFLGMSEAPSDERLNPLQMLYLSSSHMAQIPDHCQQPEARRSFGRSTNTCRRARRFGTCLIQSLVV